MATVIQSNWGGELGAIIGLIQMLQGNRRLNQEDAQREEYSKGIIDALRGRKTSVDTGEIKPVQMELASGEKWNKDFPVYRPMDQQEQAMQDRELQFKIAALNAGVPREMRIDTSSIFPTRQPRSGLSFEEQAALKTIQPPSKTVLDIENRNKAKMSQNIVFQKLMANYMKTQSDQDRIALSESAKTMGLKLDFTPKPGIIQKWFGDNPPAVVARDKNGNIVGFDESGNRVEQKKEKQPVKKGFGDKYKY